MICLKSTKGINEVQVLLCSTTGNQQFKKHLPHFTIFLHTLRKFQNLLQEVVQEKSFQFLQELA